MNVASVKDRRLFRIGTSGFRLLIRAEGEGHHPCLWGMGIMSRKQGDLEGYHVRGMLFHNWRGTVPGVEVPSGTLYRVRDGGVWHGRSHVYACSGMVMSCV